MNILARRGVSFLILAAALIPLSIAFVDRPLAEIAAAHAIILRGFFPLAAAPGGLLLLALGVQVLNVLLPGEQMRASRLWRTATTCSASVLWTAAAVELVLKRVFGRLGPTAWIEQHAFGFHLLAGRDPQFRSFPSGEAAVTIAVISVLWFSYPRWRLLLAFAALAEGFLLVDLNWHYVSDIIAGGMCGIIGGVVAGNLLEPCDASRRAN